MFGQNLILKPENHAGEFLKVVKIFTTLQGEGPFCGEPAVFIRLGGCNLQCSFCDTEFDKFTNMSLTQILKLIEQKIAKSTINLIVITGGEPMRQPIEKLCSLLITRKFKVQIETNGTIIRKLPTDVYVVCSPKLTNGQYYIKKPLIDFANCFKFLLTAKGEYNFVPKLDTSKPIYVQPIDSYNKKQNLLNQKFTMKLALKHGYIYSLQQHKILNIE